MNGTFDWTAVTRRYLALWREQQALGGAVNRDRTPTPFLWSALPPALPGELDEAGIAELIDELNRRGETTVRELLEVLEPTRLSAGQRVGLAVAV